MSLYTYVFCLALQEPTIDYGFQRLQKLIPRHPGDPDKLPKVRLFCFCCLCLSPSPSLCISIERFSFSRFLSQEIILKRAADLAEALYSMPRNNQLSLSAPRSPTNSGAMASSGFNAYTGQLAVTVHENGTGQWTEGTRNASARAARRVILFPKIYWS